jgi:hypothetical protein
VEELAASATDNIAVNGCVAVGAFRRLVEALAASGAVLHRAHGSRRLVASPPRRLRRFVQR